MSVSAADQTLTGSLRIQRGSGGNVADTFLSQGAPNRNYGNRMTLDVRTRRESLVYFDTSAIPPGAVITNAKLSLFLIDELSFDFEDWDFFKPNPVVVNFYRATAAWDESTATYASFGQQFDPTVVASLHAAGQVAMKSVDVTAVVQQWANGVPNDGLVLRTPEGFVQFLSSEAPWVALRPTLSITYSLPDDHCTPNPCQNAGTCANTTDGFTCTCQPGYTDPTCGTVIDECATNPCLNGGVCTSGIDTYTCACPAGYTGTNCETLVDNCTPNPCDNGGTCTNGVDTFTCACAPGYTGATCDTLIDNCADSPCLNGGTCANGVDTYTCTCADGFTGTNCETNIDDCIGNQCQNGSTCVDGIASYTCSCVPGYTGQYCETLIDNCASDPCLNGGTCVNEVDAYQCDCAPGFTGTNCEIDIDDCAPNPCQNGGTCTDGIASYTCTCAAGFYGTNCQNPDDTTSLTLTVPLIVVGQAPLVIATVTDTLGNLATGTVTITGPKGQIVPCTLAADTSTTSTCTALLLPLITGNYTVSAVYGGDSEHEPSSASTLFSVGFASTTTTLAPIGPLVAKTPVTVTATVAPVAPGGGKPTGSVLFRFDGDVCVGALDSTGHASCDLTPQATGTFNLTGTYSSDGNFLGSSASESVEVD